MRPQRKRPLGYGRHLRRIMGQVRVEMRPIGRRIRPDHRLRPQKIRVVKRARPNESEVRTRVGQAEQRRAAFGTEAPAHGVAAVRHAVMPAYVARNRQPVGREADIHRP